MKSLMVFLLFILAGLTTHAASPVPEALRDLIPAGKNYVKLAGKTGSSEPCELALDASSNSGFSASVQVAGKNPRFASFQIGFGHKLVDFVDNHQQVYAMSEHRAEEQYSSDSRETFNATVAAGQVTSAHITMFSKGLFGWKKKADETCFVP